MAEKEVAPKNEFWEWTKALLIAFAVAALVKYFLFTPIVVDGESMTPTLQDRDRMIVNKIGYSIGGPDRFEIVVFHAPAGKNYIKRIIGLPGDKVEYRNDQLYINDEPLDEPYLDEKKAMLLDGTLTEDFIVERVPDDEIFVMGDNRRGSTDSRHIGPVANEKVIGQTSIVFWPFKQIGKVK